MDLKTLNNRIFKNYRECEIARNAYTENYISEYLADFENAVNNAREYGDSMMRYLRQTKYIRIIGKICTPIYRSRTTPND